MRESNTAEEVGIEVPLEGDVRVLSREDRLHNQLRPVHQQFLRDEHVY